MQREKMASRLKKIEGQIRGLQRMIDEGRGCEDILTQLMAARAALDKVGVIIASNYVEECLTSSDSEAGRKKLVQAIRVIFPYYAPGPASERDSD